MCSARVWSLRAAFLLMLSCFMLPGCSGGERPAGGEDPAVRAQALIEAGNQAYGAGDYELAARRFGAAAVVKDDDAAAYFGLGMSLSKLGRDEEARVAYSRARRLASEQEQAGRK